MPSKKQTQRSELLNPTRVFIAILIAVIVWFAPIAFPLRSESMVKIDEPPQPLLSLFASSADACPFGCVKCTSWDEDAWPRHCSTYECMEGCGGDDGGGGGGTNQPPTITHTLNCLQNGNNGWCKGALTLDLTASDPQNSQVIISGDVNGVAFACPAGDITCSIPLPEGAGNANYKVDSATGLSAMGSTGFFSDLSTPQLDGAVSGVVGANGWYTSNVMLAVISSDSISGIASTTTSIDGGAPTNYQSPTTFTDGVHNVTITTTDNAGHETQTTTSFSIDTLTPILNVSLSGTIGLNGWYVSNVTLTASTSDAGSGLATLEVSQDGAAFTNYQSPITFTDGTHSYQFRATDNAGNVTESGQTLNVDTVTPTLSISKTGITGSNGWYVSNVTIIPTTGDLTSGVASLEISQDNSQYTNYQSPIIFFDGVHSYTFKVTDYAGNVTETTQTVKVDTITPSINLNISGTRGQNDWYVSDVNVTPTTTDATSGIATVEVSQDGSPYTNYQSPNTFSDGTHTYQFRVTDNAGNITEIPVQTLSVDTIAPVIEMDEELKLGEYLYYDLEDPSVAGRANSGLYIYRAVIEDDDEQYKKIVWLDSLDGNKARDSILWDGKFADGVQAGIGEYFITLKISDAAGNERMQTAIVKIGLFSFLQNIPTFTPPASSLPPMGEGVQRTDEGNPLTFGGQTTTATGITTTESAYVGGTTNTDESRDSTSTSTGGLTAFNSEANIIYTGFTQGSESTSAPIASTNILWGAIAAATVGATLFDWQKKREEEEARQLVTKHQGASDEDDGGWEKERRAKRARQRANRFPPAVTAQPTPVYIPSQTLEDEETNWLKKLNPVYQYEKLKAEKLQAQQAASQQARDDFHAQERQDNNPVKQPTWWENTVNWIDKYQPEASIGVGAVVGLAAIAITLAIVTTVTLPALLVAAGVAAIVAAITVAAGTVALNTHFERPPTANILENVRAAAVTAAIVSGVGLFVAGGLLTQATIVAGNAIAGTCAANPAFCANAGTVLNVVDTLEESSLALKFAIQTATGNPQAGETAIELQLELMDGGVPGNSIALELGEQLAKLGPDAAELITKHGDEIVPLLLQYGDDAVDIIGAYGDEGITLLTKFGPDTGEAISLVKEFGTPAIRLFDSLEVESAGRLLHNLEPDVLDYAMKQGPDALAALSGWKATELMEFGPDLVLRAEKDARALEAVKNLVSSGPIDPKHLTPEQQGLIKIIAENSMQYTDEGQVVLGKWVDYGNGFTSVARETGSVHYNPHPDMWKILGDLGKDRRESTAWLVNEQVIQTGIYRGLPFEYALEGIPAKDILQEKQAIDLIFSGASDSEIQSVLRVNKLSIRWQELKELQKAGYEFVFDEINNSFILSLP